MNTTATSTELYQANGLLRGDLGVLVDWSQHWTWRRVTLCVGILVAGCGVYGGAIGWWHSPQQALYSAIKLPAVLLLTSVTNGMLNGILAPLLGLNIGFRQAFLAVLISFTIAAIILTGFTPLILFLIWNVPSLSSHAPIPSYSVIMIVLVAVIAFAGIAGNARLLQLLRQLSGSATIARRILIAWLGGNLFLGAQISWILRPFVGSPSLPVEFVRADGFHGTFYEAVFHSLKILLAP
jgi:hypothetical protein